MSVTAEPSIAGIVILIPIVVLIATSIVALFVAKNRVIRILAAALLLSFGMVVLLGMLLVPALTLWKSSAERGPYSTTIAPPRSSSVETTWDSATEEALSASIYSSPESAARALAQSCLETLLAKLSEPPSQIEVVVHSPMTKYSPALETQLAAFVRGQIPLSGVSHSVSQEPPSPSEETLLIFVDLVGVGVSSNAPWDASSEFAQGQIRLRGTYQEEVYEDLRRFVQKPWVDNFDDFISQRPGRRLMRANSNAFSVSEQESDRSAREQAAKLLSSRIQQSQGVPPGRALQIAVQSALDNEEVIVDRFSQKLSSQSGDVWRTTLLIDARPATLANIVQQPGSKVRRYESRRRSAWIGIGVVLALTVFLYFVLDELTRGYFVWNLRVTALLSMLTLAIVFCWWMNAMT